MDLDQLRLAAQERDPEAWETLGRALSQELHRFFSNSFDKTSAEDLAQATVLVVYRKFEEFEPAGPHSFRNWVLAIAGRQGRERLAAPFREAARLRKLRAKPSPVPPTSPGSRLLRRERLEIIADCLPKLPDTHRRVIENDLAGDDASSLAAREGITVAGARVRRHRAISSLKQIVAAQTTPA
jgi:RNA polymerase sigma factor (sigma-70 family)